MSEAVDFESEEFGIDDLIKEEEKEQAEQQAEAEKPDNSDLEKARLFAEKMNTGFLFGVNKMVCPSVEAIDDFVDREAGVDALTPLALSMGGAAPDWVVEFMQKYQPYIAAGMYMGMTIYTASQMEKMIIAEAEAANSKKDDTGEKGNSDGD